jgi:predicted phosphoadenosine phosphosulfate sulfurtransferase
MLLLDTMPRTTAEHYRNKFAVYLKWYKDHKGLEDLPDSVPGDTGSKDVGSWRRLARCLLRNDHWCASLSFGAQKNSAYKKYQDLMRRRRQEWGIFPDVETQDEKS